MFDAPLRISLENTTLKLDKKMRTTRVSVPAVGGFDDAVDACHLPASQPLLRRRHEPRRNNLC